METLETLAAQLDATSDIRSIVRVMKALSAASIRSFETAVEAIAEYERTVELGLRIVLRQAGPSPGRAAAHGGGTALLVIGSDRGLCGRFNDRLAAFTRDRLTSHEAAGRGVTVGVAGFRAAARLEACGHAADAVFDLPGSARGLTDTVRAMVVELQRWIDAGRADEISVIHNRRGAGAIAEPAARRILPAPRPYLDDLTARPWPSPRLPMFRMDRDALLSWLLQEHLFVAIYRALAESGASEHAARLAAMQGAERNIDERREDLAAAYRRKRQETITRELLDVVSGFESARRRG